MLDLGAGRILSEKVAALAVGRRPDRAWDEPAPAIRANVFQDRIYAPGAERALVAADPRFQRVRRKGLVAVLTGRPEFKHSWLGARRRRQNKPRPLDSERRRQGRRRYSRMTPSRSRLLVHLRRRLDARSRRRCCRGSVGCAAAACRTADTLRQDRDWAGRTK